MREYELTARPHSAVDPGNYMSVVAGPLRVMAESPRKARDLATSHFIIARERSSVTDDTPSALWSDSVLSDIREVGPGAGGVARVLSPEGWDD